MPGYGKAKAEKIMRNCRSPRAAACAVWASASRPLAGAFGLNAACDTVICSLSLGHQVPARARWWPVCCAEVPDAWVSRSVTTRAPREGEVDGVHYQFASDEEFQDLVDTDGLLEWATYAGNRYGTPRATVEDHMACGEQVILEIDVQGAFQVRDKMPAARLVFIEPPSLQVLEERLRGRGTESDEVIEARMKAAEVELFAQNGV